MTQTPFRFSGKARFDDLVYDVISRDEYLDAHVEVVVHEVSGSRIVVTALPKSSTSPDPKSA
jgi:membrane-bound ClpP family serine protease